MKRQRALGRLGGLALLQAALFGLGACAGGVDTHGNLPDPQVVQEIRPGVHNRDDVLNLLGSPSTISTFQDRRWYYIGSKSETVAFFAPDVLERNVLVVSFSDKGLVDDKQVYSLKDGQEVTPVDRVTPTEGKELSLIQQLFGNVGRFSGDKQGGQRRY